MINRPPIFTLLCTILLVSAPAHTRSQSISNFASARLQVSGGDANVADTRCSIYTGWLSVSPAGAITGTIFRRNFNPGQSNSTAAVLLNIQNTSRVFGSVANEGSVTNTDSWNSYVTNAVSWNSGTRTTVITYYGADFYIATQNPNFFVKGRAKQEASVGLAVETNVYTQPDPQDVTQMNFITVTNVTTNTWTWNSVSLGGVSFAGASNSAAIRGIFNADEVLN